MENICEDYNIDPKMCVFVTDRGANMINALEPYRRLNCANHIINNILEHATNSVEELKNCKQLVCFFKKSNNLQNQLKITPKAACSTRWNSQLEMINSIKKNWTDICIINGKAAITKDTRH